MRYFISPPFGNYIKHPNAISVTGSWTLKERPGLLLQIFKTLRYTKNGWKNKIGLRNKGIQYALEKKTDSVLSIASIKELDLNTMHMIIPNKQNVEINLSCPNIDKDLNVLPKGLDVWKNGDREWCILKISPTTRKRNIDKLIDLGFNQIHASNTLPTDDGGLSGKILKPYTLKNIEYIKSKYSHVTCIAGGGVTEISDVNTYLNVGADHISLGTVCFTPWKMNKILNGVKNGKSE